MARRKPLTDVAPSAPAAPPPAPSARATTEQVDRLHGLTAGALIKLLESGEISAALMNSAINFLAATRRPPQRRASRKIA